MAVMMMIAITQAKTGRARKNFESIRRLLYFAFETGRPGRPKVQGRLATL
jgi:hypothetical protein